MWWTISNDTGFSFSLYTLIFPVSIIPHVYNSLELQILLKYMTKDSGVHGHDSWHMHRQSKAVTVQHGNPLDKLVLAWKYEKLV
jgi:hypothetical protein